MKESPYIMMSHGVAISVACYTVLRYGAGNAHNSSEVRAIVTGLVASLYMVMYGHQLPNWL
jgi:hypothetical protein